MAKKEMTAAVAEAKIKIEEYLDDCRRIKAFGFAQENRPLAAFAIAGGAGSGKSFLARAIAESFPGGAVYKRLGSADYYGVESNERLLELKIDAALNTKNAAAPTTVLVMDDLGTVKGNRAVERALCLALDGAFEDIDHDLSNTVIICVGDEESFNYRLNLRLPKKFSL